MSDWVIEAYGASYRCKDLTIHLQPWNWDLGKLWLIAFENSICKRVMATIITVLNLYF